MVQLTQRRREGDMASMRQKIGVIGVGAVGSASLLSTVLRGVAREIVVVDREPERAREPERVPPGPGP